MQTIDKQRLIEWVEKHKIGPFKDVINYNDLLSFIEKETSESDVLQEGDWFEGSKHQYAQCLLIEGCTNDAADYWGEHAVDRGFLVYSYGCLRYDSDAKRSTSKPLEPSEFLRRARNTFKNK